MTLFTCSKLLLCLLHRIEPDIKMASFFVTLKLLNMWTKSCGVTIKLNKISLAERLHSTIYF